MKIITIILGVVVILIGVLPIIEGSEVFEFLSFIPTSGIAYNLIVIVAGVVIVLHGTRKEKLRNLGKLFK